MPADCHILHVDMDAFFASVEQRDNPALRGQPVLVGFDGPRGVVAAASYEARVFGCHSAMPMAAAKRACPRAIVVPVRHGHYRAVSHQVFGIFDRFSPLVQPLSVDEAFLDLHGTDRLHGPAVDVAARLKQAIHAELDLTASVGVAPNKFLAKLASDLHKPDGLTVIAPHDIDRILLPLPITKMWGVGAVTAAKLATRGIHTFADLRRLSPEQLQPIFGNDAPRMFDLARGIDGRAVTPDRDAKQISHEQTFGQNLTDVEHVRQVLADHAERVGRRLRQQNLRARGVSLKIRFGAFETITRSTTLEQPTDCTADLWNAGDALLRGWPFRPVRLIGLAAGRLTQADQQLDLFPDPTRARQQQLDAVADQINARFGGRAITRASAAP